MKTGRPLNGPFFDFCDTTVGARRLCDKLTPVDGARSSTVIGWCAALTGAVVMLVIIPVISILVQDELVRAQALSLLEIGEQAGV